MSDYADNSSVSRCVASMVRPAELADQTRTATILAEYCDSLAIVIRDTAADIRSYLTSPSGLWLAQAGADIVGCIALRPLTDEIGEIKRLYVRPTHRGKNLADALLDALESGARERGFQQLYLDTHEGLSAAKRFYERRGYFARDRYNDNPQATIFMQRKL